MSVLYEGLRYCALMVLVIMSWSCWTDNDATEADSVICLSPCIILYVCGASSRGDATFGGWLSPWLDSPALCTCVSTLFVREAICISFSLTVKPIRKCWFLIIQLWSWLNIPLQIVNWTPTSYKIKFINELSISNLINLLGTWLTNYYMQAHHEYMSII